MPKEAVFTISISPAPTEPVVVNYATRDGTATVADGDYSPRSGMLTFGPGQTVHEVAVPVSDAAPGESTEMFYLDVSWPGGSTNLVARGTGVATIPGSETADVFLQRFRWAYDTLKAPANGYFGPPAGPKARTIPYHAREKTIIVEAPDWTHESVSETVSFWMKLEAWKAILDGDASGINACWNTIEQSFIPDGTYGQPWGAYTPDAPAAYVPDAVNLEDTPLDYDTSRDAGPDPLYQPLKTAYGNSNVYLMHWLLDVDGDYGFRNPDGSRVGVFINNYQRGPAEDGLATITHACYDDFENGGHPEFGWQPIYSQAKPVYPDSQNPNEYSKQWNYSVAPDAESRVIASAYLAAIKTSGLNLIQSNTKAKKMADYQRYALYDKYFQPIQGYDQSGCHYLLSWGCGFGGGVPEDGNDSYWGFRIGNSEVHFGYNCVDVAYACKTGGIYAPNAAGAPAQYAVSLSRQLELIRWLQSPEGPIAGGVTSNWKGRYETPTDGRQTAKFYGMYYTYSPSWQNPPSNNWTGYQAWGVERVAALYVDVAGKTDAEAQSLAFRCGVILDRWVKWFMQSCTLDVGAGVLAYPINSRWTSDTAIPGQTATVPTRHGDYEFLPSLEWDSTGNYEAFWSAGSVPNPNLHYFTTEMGWDPGTAGGFVQILVEYCQAKKMLNGGVLAGMIPGTSISLPSVLQRAKDIMEIVWQKRSQYGFGSEGSLAIPRLDDVLWIPPEFGTGAMPNGEVLANGQTTFASMRASLYEATAEWQGIRDYLDGVTTVEPRTTYHRFWNGVDVAVAFGMLSRYFGSQSGAGPGDGGGGDDGGDPDPGGWTPPTYSAVPFPGTSAGLIGDSITYQNSLYVGPQANGRFAYYSFGMAGWWNYAMMLGNHPFGMDAGVSRDINGTKSGFNFGIAGSKVSDWWKQSFTPIPNGPSAMGPMYAYRQAKNAINIVTVLGGTNDLAANASAEDVLLNLRKAIYECAADGKWVFVITIPPRTTDLLQGYTLTRQDTIRARIQQVNDGLRAEFGGAVRKANIWLCDPWDELVGPNGVDPHGLQSDRVNPNGASTPGNYRPGADQIPYFPDGLHPGIQGAFVIGQKLWQTMQAAGVPGRAANKIGPFTAGATNLVQNPGFTVTNTPRPAYSKTLGRAIGLGAARLDGPGYQHGVVPDHWFVYRASNQDQESYSNFGEYTFSALVGQFPELAAYMVEPSWQDGRLLTSIVQQGGRTGFKLDFTLPSGNKNEGFIFRTNIPAGQNGPWNNYGWSTGSYEPPPTNNLYQPGDKLAGEMDVILSNVKGLHTFRLTLNFLCINDQAVSAGDPTSTGAKISALGLAQNVWPPGLIEQNRFPSAGMTARHRTPIVIAPQPAAGERSYAQFQLEVGLDGSKAGGASCSVIIFEPKVNVFTGAIL